MKGQQLKQHISVEHLGANYPVTLENNIIGTRLVLRQKTKGLSRDYTKKQMGYLRTRAIRCLGPIVCGVLLHVGGRLELANIASDVKHPVSVSPGQDVNQLVVGCLHLKQKNVSLAQPSALLRNNNWNGAGRAIGHRILNSFFYGRQNVIGGTANRSYSIATCA